LANPARAPFQLLGVGRQELLDPLAGALARLGVRHAFLVCGLDGLDEVSLSSATLVREVQNGSVGAFEWTADDFGLEPCAMNELLASGPEQSAKIIESVLAGEPSAASRVVIANAAAGLLAAQKADSPREAARLSVQSISAGRARRALEQLILLSNERPVQT
jgi:anthranilate phosphoribosyltransferase